MRSKLPFRRRRLSHAVAGILSIGGSSAAGQALTLLLVPVLARIYEPTAFGIYAAIIAVTTIFAVTGPLRLDSAIQIANDEEVPTLVSFSILSSLIAGGICCAIIYYLPHETNFDTTAGLAIIALVFTGAAYNIFSSLALRSRQYGAIARRNLARQLGTSGAQLGAGAVNSGPIGLIGGAVVGQILSLLVFFRLISQTFTAILFCRPRVTHLRTYWRFPLLFAPAAALNALAIQVPLLIISFSFGSADAGVLSQALRVGAAPALVIGVAFSSVILGELASKVRAGEVDQRQSFLRASRGLACLGLIWLVGLFLIVPPMLPTILGEGWDGASQFTRAIALSASASIVVAPLSSVLVVYQRAAAAFALDISRILLTTTGGLASAALGASAFRVCLIMTVASTLIYVITWFVCLWTVSDGTIERLWLRRKSAPAGAE